MPAATVLNHESIAGLLQPLQGASRWIVGYSGGLDSTVLLHLCHTYLGHTHVQAAATSASPAIPTLSALHIDHQLMPDHAAWTEHCAEFCAQHCIELNISKVNVESAGSGLEQAARTARYAAFAEPMQHAGAVLLLAHHQNDQAETVLLRLFRGSGMRGAAAMDSTREFAAGTLARPLLNMPRGALQSYAQAHGLAYIDDPSNNDETLDRNFVRRRVLPTIAGHWPAVIRALARFAGHASNNERLAMDLAAIDFAAVVNHSDLYGEPLRIDRLTALPAYRRTNLYRFWLDRHDKLMPSAGRLLMLSAERLGQIDMLAVNNRSASALPLNGHSIRVHDGGLYCVSEQWLQKLLACYASPIPWDGQAAVELYGCGILRDAAVKHSGARGLAAGSYWIGPRKEGAIARLHGQGKPLKKLLQEAGIPAWLRDAYPVIYSAQSGSDEIAAVGDICVCDNFVAEQGARLHWRYQQPAYNSR